MNAGLPICGLLTAIALLTGRQALGYQGETTPAPQGLRAAPLSLPDASPQAPSSIPTPVAGDQSTLEIPIPEVFRGCWTGTVAKLDSSKALRSTLFTPRWLPKSYLLCFVQSGQEPWQVSLATGGLADESHATEVARSVRRLSSTPDSVRLSAFLEFRYSILFIPVHVKEWTELRCSVTSLGVMHVEAQTFVADPEPLSLDTWHADFTRTSDSNPSR